MAHQWLDCRVCGKEEHEFPGLVEAIHGERKCLNELRSSNPKRYEELSQEKFLCRSCDGAERFMGLARAIKGEEHCLCSSRNEGGEATGTATVSLAGGSVCAPQQVQGMHGMHPAQDDPTSADARSVFISPQQGAPGLNNVSAPEETNGSGENVDMSRRPSPRNLPLFPALPDPGASVNKQQDSNHATEAAVGAPAVLQQPGDTSGKHAAFFAAQLDAHRATLQEEAALGDIASDVPTDMSTGSINELLDFPHVGITADRGGGELRRQHHQPDLVAGAKRGPADPGAEDRRTRQRASKNNSTCIFGKLVLWFQWKFADDWVHVYISTNLNRQNTTDGSAHREWLDRQRRHIVAKEGRPLTEKEKERIKEGMSREKSEDGHSYKYIFLERLTSRAEVDHFYDMGATFYVRQHLKNTTNRWYFVDSEVYDRSFGKSMKWDSEELFDGSLKEVCGRLSRHLEQHQGWEPFALAFRQTLSGHCGATRRMAMRSDAETQGKNELRKGFNEMKRAFEESKISTKGVGGSGGVGGGGSGPGNSGGGRRNVGGYHGGGGYGCGPAPNGDGTGDGTGGNGSGGVDGGRDLGGDRHGIGGGGRPRACSANVTDSTVDLLGSIPKFIAPDPDEKSVTTDITICTDLDEASQVGKEFSQDCDIKDEEESVEMAVSPSLSRRPSLQTEDVTGMDQDSTQKTTATGGGKVDRANVASQMEHCRDQETLQNMQQNSPGLLNQQRKGARMSRLIKTDVSGLPQGTVLLPFRQLLLLESFISRQDIERNGVPLLRTNQSDIWLAVFVSHRWSAPDHPDPQGTQLSALKQFVRMVISLVQLAREYPIQDNLPDTLLARHGWLQAAYVAGMDSLRTRGEGTSSSEELKSKLLDHCGIWYDFSCMYQNPRTDEQEAVLRESLRNMSEVIEGCSCTISLRSSDDGYMERGWCVYEMLASMNVGPQALGGEVLDFPLILHIDQVDQPQPLAEEFLFSEHLDNTKHIQDLRFSFIKDGSLLIWALQSWPRCVQHLQKDGTVQLDQEFRRQDSPPSFRYIVEVVTDSLCLSFSYLPVTNGVVLTDIRPATTFGDLVASRIEQSLEDLRTGSKESVDLYALLESSMTSSGLRYTRGSDVCLVAIMILERYNPVKNLHGFSETFVEEALRRVLNKEKSLVLRLAQEDGVAVDGRFFFDGDPSDAY